MFLKFFHKYNGVSIYNHMIIDSVELEACLIGLGVCWKKYGYVLSIPKDYLNLSIVHLDMLNVLLGVRVLLRIGTAANYSINAIIMQSFRY